MIVWVERVVRLSLAVALVSGLGLAATSARAQFITTPVCAEAEAIASNFGDEDNWADFGAVSNCNKICKSYVNKCKAFSKNWHACVKKGIGDNAELERKAFCDTQEDNADKKACKEDVNAEEQDVKDETKSIKEELLTFCDEIEDACVSECESVLIPK